MTRSTYDRTHPAQQYASSTNTSVPKPYTSYSQSRTTTAESDAKPTYDAADSERKNRAWRTFTESQNRKIGEVQEKITQLQVDLDKLDKLDQELEQTLAAEKSWWPLGRPSLSQEQKVAMELDRLQRNAARSIKTTKLERAKEDLKKLKYQKTHRDAMEHARLQSEYNQRVYDEKAAQAKRNEQERKAQQEKTRAEAERVRQEWHKRKEAEDKERQAQDERIRATFERVAAAMARDKEMREQRARDEQKRKEEEAERQRMKDEADDYWDRVRRREEVRQAARQQAEKEKAERQEVERQQENREAEARRRLMEELNENKTANVNANVQDKMNKPSSSNANHKTDAPKFNTARDQNAKRKNKAKGTTSPKQCTHRVYWKQVDGQHTCSQCHKAQKKFALECPSCKTMACLSCMRFLKVIER